LVLGVRLGASWHQIPQISVHDLKDADDITPLDVRKPVNIGTAGISRCDPQPLLGELREKLKTLDKSAPYATYGKWFSRQQSLRALLAANGFTTFANRTGKAGRLGLRPAIPTKRRKRNDQIPKTRTKRSQRTDPTPYRGAYHPRCWERLEQAARLVAQD